MIVTVMIIITAIHHDIIIAIVIIIHTYIYIHILYLSSKLSVAVELISSRKKLK